MSSLTLTIKEVEREFAIWRRNKKGQPTIPEALIHKVEILLKSHKHSIVLRRLGLSARQARNKGLLPMPSNTNHHLQVTPSSFIKIPMQPEIVNKIHSGTTTLTLKRGDTQLSLDCPSYDQIQLIINTLLR